MALHHEETLSILCLTLFNLIIQTLTKTGGLDFQCAHVCTVYGIDQGFSISGSDKVTWLQLNLRYSG